MVKVIYDTSTREFHLYNQRINYILSVLESGQLGQLYLGKKLTHRDSFAHFIQMRTQSHTAYVYENDSLFSLDTIRQEYPSYGTTDFREPAYQVEQGNGNRTTGSAYKSHEIYSGKKKLNGLPAAYTEDDQGAVTLDIILEGPLIQVQLILSYMIFEDYDVVYWNAKFVNHGCRIVELDRAMSLSIDLYDNDFEMIQLDGAWLRERHIVRRELVGGIQSVSSARGASSMDHNPFIALKRPWATEQFGEVYGFCLIYSGNFLAQVEVDRCETTRVMMGINPFELSWMLETGEEFQTPEGVVAYFCEGLNGMSQDSHSLFTKQLVRGSWREKERPVLLNNWEAIFFKFDEKKVLDIAKKARHFGVELFVLDDGWLGKQDDAGSSLDDRYSDLNKLPDGVEGLSRKIAELGLEFGLWFEPEMINKNSELYQNHEEWVIRMPERPMSQGRDQYVLDFPNPEVVDHVYNMMHKVLSNSEISYIKWDMNQNITEAYGATLGVEKQGEFLHRYILGVYDLYEKLIQSFLDILFESCASGGGRFDAGMLYYAPRYWISDDTDAVERVKIQYGTSMMYPLSSAGAHVSAVPNHQVKQMTSIGFRANVAFFGAPGYKLDPNQMTKAEQSAVMEQIQFCKKYRNVFRYGRFYRLKGPFGSQGDAAWMIVSEDRKIVIVSCYRVLATSNPKLKKVLLRGLDPQMMYVCAETGRSYYGDELMNMGMLMDIEFTGSSVRKKEVTKKNSGSDMGDFTSQMYVLECRAQGDQAVSL